MVHCGIESIFSFPSLFGETKTKSEIQIGIIYSFNNWNFSAAAVYNQVYSKLSTNQKQSYICKSAIYAYWNGLSKFSSNQ